MPAHTTGVVKKQNFKMKANLNQQVHSGVQSGRKYLEIPDRSYRSLGAFSWTPLVGCLSFGTFSWTPFVRRLSLDAFRWIVSVYCRHLGRQANNADLACYAQRSLLRILR